MSTEEQHRCPWCRAWFVVVSLRVEHMERCEVRP